MPAIPVENLRIELNASLRLHVDRAEMRAANWVCIEGWLADWPRGEIEIASGWRDAYCVLSERPDVCQALELEADLAWGFVLHLLDPAPAPAGQMEASLSRDGAVFARLDFAVPPNMLPCLPFATPAAIALTRRLYRNPVTGEDADQSPISSSCPTVL